MLIPVMTDEQFIRLAIVRKSQVKEWKAIPEAERPTWEQFKRGLKRKKNSKITVDFLQ